MNRNELDNDEFSNALPGIMRRNSKTWAIRRRAIKITLIVISLIILTAIGSYIYDHQSKPDSPISADLTRDLPYTPLYPASAPHGFKLEENSVQQPEEGVILYNFSDDSGTLIHVSMQPIPEGIEREKLPPALSEEREIKTSNGTATVGNSASDKTVAKLFTDESWIIVTFNRDALSDETVTSFLSSLRKV